jgi:signal peptide peptidase SppA
MSRDLPHVVSQVFNTPLMIHGDKFDTILAAVGPRILSGQELALPPDMAPRADAYGRQGPQRFENGGYLAEDGIAVLPVLGTLVRRGSYLDSLSGMTSYARLSNAALEMLSASTVRGIMLEIDSYGGEAGGCFDLVTFLRQAAADAGKPIWAAVNETGASAAYAVACAAEEIWLPRMGAVGSIGVVMAHVDMSKADEKTGLKWTFIYNGEHKLDGNPHMPLPADVKARVQTDVDATAAMFHDLVAESRNMTVEAVRETKAGMLRGRNAIEAGLADNLGTFAEAMNAFAEHLNSNAPAAGSRRSMAAVDQQRKVAMAANAPKSRQRAEASESQTETTEGEAGNTTSTENATDTGTEQTESGAAQATAVVPPAALATAAGAADFTAERARVTGLMKLATFAETHGVTFDAAAAVDSNMALDKARETVMEAMATRSEGQAIANRTPHPTASAANSAAGWDNALKAVAARSGLTIAG